MLKAVSRERFWNLCKGLVDGSGSVRVVSWPLLPQSLLEPCPEQFDRVEVGRVGRQVQEMASRLLDDALDLAAFVDGRVVQHERGSWQQTGQQFVLEEPLDIHAGHRAVATGGRNDAVNVHRAQQGQVLAALGGHRLFQRLAFLAPAIQNRQRQRDACLIQKNQIVSGERSYLLLERFTLERVALGGDAALFLCENPSFASRRETVASDRAAPPCSCHAAAKLWSVQSVRDAANCANAASCSGVTLGARPVL